MKSLRATALALVLVFSVGSCATVASTLPKVMSVVSDAALIVEQIDSFSAAVFKAVPNADLEKKVEQAINIARKALATANRTASGAENLSQSQLAAAFDDFRIAYQNLLALVGPLGVTTGSGAGGALGASGCGSGSAGDGGLCAIAGERLQVPEPLALSL